MCCTYYVHVMEKEKISIQIQYEGAATFPDGVKKNEKSEVINFHTRWTNLLTRINHATDNI